MRERSTEAYKKAVLRKLQNSDLSDRQFAIDEAEAAALLLLQKKLDALWNKSEDV